MGHYDVRHAELAIKDMIRYDAIKGTDGTIIKDMGNYVQMLIPADNEKEHDTYDIYFDIDGKMEKVIGHSGNLGFVGTKFF